MFNKLLIAVGLLTIAIVTTATTATTAAIATAQADPQQSGAQDVRPVPQVPNAEAAGGEQPGEQVTEEFHQTYPLSATGRVTLGNINGGVKIKVWDRAAVQVDAIKKAYRRERLAEAQIEVTSTEENIRIKTEYPDRDQNFRSGEGRYDNPATIEYALTVPRTAMLDSVELVNGQLDIDGVEGNVKASSVNGSVTARGLKGEARLSTVNGPLQATFLQLDETKPISLGSVNGNVTVVIPSDSNASVRAGTVHGSISNDFGIQVKHGEYVGHNLEAQIGSGGPRIKLSNVNGAITITRAQDGRPVSPVTSIARVERTRDEMMAEDIAREVEMTTAELTLQKMEAAREARETRTAQREAQRVVDAEMRKTQREIERAQRELQRQQTEIRVRVPRVFINRNNDEWNKASSQETKTFAVSGTPRVNITTFDGPVTVRGWDQSEVRYTATKRAADDESLKQISIRAEQQGQAISINAQNENNANGSVHLEVSVPRNSSLHVTSGDGPLTLDGVSGDITLRSGDGPISVNNSGGQLHVNTGDGPIHINKFDGQVDARTGDGPIALDGNFNALSARTGDGEISLTVPAGSSFTIETNSTEEISNEGFTVAEDATLSPRVKRWKVGNGGRVFILRTGEGKVLLRPRN
jgi:DUF4097 and DUF4098 domain-containing protein YvlB